ncbi:hypothetical protein [Mobilicoccus caccae]|nr:hypothetical protein [Mobilicoccus caccae]
MRLKHHAGERPRESGQRRGCQMIDVLARARAELGVRYPGEPDLT